MKSHPPSASKNAPGRAALTAARSALFAAWTVGTVAFITYLMSLHAVPLPAAGRLPTGIAPSASAEKSWQATHVLAADCPCSGAVADYLLQRGPASDWDETVYIAGVDETSRRDVAELSAKFISRGFRVLPTSPKALQADLGVRGAPWLLFRDPRGQTRYSGGYAALRPRAGLNLDDIAILRRLQAGQTVAAHPAFGCAIDPNLQKEMDPLAFKYASPSPSTDQPLTTPE